MDELEGIIILNEEHSRTILNIEEPTSSKNSKKKNVLSAMSEHVVVTAGAKGMLRILRVSMTVSLSHICIISLTYCYFTSFLRNLE